ncbi:MAG: purine-nucleoside phosphorylase DeoD [Idiomarinaceae bacterium HL-53]|nr:MAG: purine-nucleoside phosphorylase DeoD [Idiomarinaceae bacterium HL-53]CUS49415.1 purine-nucleoside phosphorylase [Idiomarinaceae bacterium HL-53]
MATPHISASKNDFAPVVLMPGDPLRAKFIAEHWLKDVIQVNAVRNMLGYTGTYRGQRVSVMGSGMGMPSLGIYAWELFSFYQVEAIIRVGSCGSYASELEIGDVILAKEAFSESSFAQVQNGEMRDTLAASQALNSHLKACAQRIQKPVKHGAIHSSDVFYRAGPAIPTTATEKQLLGVEMEAFALFHIANTLQKHASALLTVTDSMQTGEGMPAEDREHSLADMIEIALHAATTWQKV